MPVEHQRLATINLKFWISQTQAYLTTLSHSTSSTLLIINTKPTSWYYDQNLHTQSNANKKIKIQSKNKPKNTRTTIFLFKALRPQLGKVLYLPHPKSPIQFHSSSHENFPPNFFHAQPQSHPLLVRHPTLKASIKQSSPNNQASRQHKHLEPLKPNFTRLHHPVSYISYLHYVKAQRR